MFLTPFHFFCTLPSFSVEKLQPLYLGNGSLRQPPSPTATFQGTSQNRPEAPRPPTSDLRAPKSDPRAPQERPKSSPGATQDPQEQPKSFQERPWSPQERPKSPQERPQSPQERPKSLPRATQELPRGTQELSKRNPRPSISSAPPTACNPYRGAGGTGRQPLRL